MKTCVVCGQSNDEENTRCQKCGNKLMSPMAEKLGLGIFTTAFHVFYNKVVKFSNSVFERWESIWKYTPAYIKHITFDKWDSYQNNLDVRFDNSLLQIYKEYEHDLDLARKNFENSQLRIRQGLSKYYGSLGIATASWENAVWNNFTPNIYTGAPEFVRVGTFTIKGSQRNLQIPAVIPLNEYKSIFLQSTGYHKKITIEAVQSIILRLIAGFPPGKFHITMIDPIGLGTNVAGFLNLPEKMIGNKAWTEPNQIEKQLIDITSHMEYVIQKFLRDEYQDIDKFNKHAGEVAEPYILLVIINFPSGFTDSAAKRLVSIASNGPRTGVYVIATIDGDLPLPYGFNLHDLLRAGILIKSNEDGKFKIDLTGFDHYVFKFDHPPATDIYNKIISPVAELSKQTGSAKVPFNKITIPKEEWWSSSSIQELSAPLGLKGAREIQYFELGRGMQHYSLLAGKPGSGKSNLLHVLIINLALKYSPQELILYLVDFKKGVEFKDYANNHLPHARVIGIETDREFGLSVLREIEQEMNSRGEFLRKKNFQDLETYRSKTQNHLPRILLIIDEFQRLFSEEDNLANQAAGILSHIVQQGRAFGIHTLLASQSLADAYSIGRSTYDKMNVRIALQCSEADSRLILGEDNGGARLLSRPGAAVYNSENGREDGNIFFQVAWLSKELKEAYLENISSLANKSKIAFSRPQQIIFEGNQPSKINNNDYSKRIIQSDYWEKETDNIEIILGESTNINPPITHAMISSQSRANILILGQNEKLAYSIITGAWLSIAARYHPDKIRFFITDFGRKFSHFTDLIKAINTLLPDKIAYIPPKITPSMLFDIENQINERINLGFPPQDRVFLFINGLHRFRELRDTDQYGSPGKVSQTLVKICNEGPDVGIHTIAWCDTYNNLSRLFERKILSDFDIRIALQMSEDDSSLYIDNFGARNLGSNRALLYNPSISMELEKFRPFEPVDDFVDQNIIIDAFRKKIN